MTIIKIKVVAGRTFNHPHEQYSNLRPEVTLEASLSERENPVDAVKALQAQAEGLVEDHKQGMLRSLEELYQLSERQQEMRGLQKELERAQVRLNELRNQHPELKLALGEPEED
ncbi:MAG: hypothetical protein NT154_06620 [Verrucomicrobia bacterium]|nr:hypothetical protein [Verrucomicrobiota bacterium]